MLPWLIPPRTQPKRRQLTGCLEPTLKRGTALEADTGLRQAIANRTGHKITADENEPACGLKTESNGDLHSGEEQSRERLVEHWELKSKKGSPDAGLLTRETSRVTEAQELQERKQSAAAGPAGKLNQKRNPAGGLSSTKQKKMR
jgi:hypothetical protein